MITDSIFIERTRKFVIMKTVFARSIGHVKCFQLSPQRVRDGGGEVGDVAVISSAVRAPTTAAVTAGWRRVNCSAAAGSGTPYRAQASRIRRARASTAGGAGA